MSSHLSSTLILPNDCYRFSNTLPKSMCSLPASVLPAAPEFWSVLCDAQRSSPLAILEPTLLTNLCEICTHISILIACSLLSAGNSLRCLLLVSGSLSSNSKEILCVASGPLCLFRFFVHRDIVNFRGQDKDHVYIT